VADRDVVGDGGPDGVDEGGEDVAGDVAQAEGGGRMSTCGTPGCGVCPSSARVPITAVGGDYSIDPYEVTIADYRAWLDTSPSVAGQPVECAWNDSFAPGVVSPGASAAMEDAGLHLQADPQCATWYDEKIANGESHHPATCADWCDAVAYCKWAKGRLCGKIGGGTMTFTDTLDPAKGEWWNACSNAGASAYPYGNTFQQGLCNDGQSRQSDVGAFPGCHGPAGAFDMSGNVGEWDGTCSAFGDAPPVENCLRRGGAFWDDATHLACTSFHQAPRAVADRDTGFRCCSGP
jgi:formylglycine-generating enzyme required for sulfatase activity